MAEAGRRLEALGLLLGAFPNTGCFALPNDGFVPSTSRSHLQNEVGAKFGGSLTNFIELAQGFRDAGEVVYVGWCRHHACQLLQARRLRAINTANTAHARRQQRITEAR